MRCEIFARDAAPTYHAISYTWGAPDLTRTVTIDEGCMPVRENCWYALGQARQLQTADCSYVWLDVTCINQAGLEEKNVEVADMGSLYRRAHCVVACVGPHSEDSAFFFERMPEEHSFYSISRPRGGSLDLIIPRPDVLHTDLSIYTLSETSGDACLN